MEFVLDLIIALLLPDLVLLGLALSKYLNQKEKK